MLKFQDQSKQWHSSSDSLSFIRRHFIWAGDFSSKRPLTDKFESATRRWTQSRSMLAAKDSNFGVTGELLTEILVAANLNWWDRKCRREVLIDSTEGLLVLKRSKHGTLVLHRCCLVAVEALQTFHCPLECSLKTFFRPNNAKCFFTSKSNLTLRHEEARYVLSSPAGIASIFLLSFCLAGYRENMFKYDLVLYTVFFISFIFFTSNHQWNLESFLSCC